MKRPQHISVLELQAILLGLKALAKNLSHAPILIQSDSMAAIASINRLGSNIAYPVSVSDLGMGADEVTLSKGGAYSRDLEHLGGSSFKSGGG